MIKYINNIAGILIFLNIFDQILSSSKIIPENIYFDIFVIASYIFFGTEFILRIIIERRFSFLLVFDFVVSGKLYFLWILRFKNIKNL